MLIVEILKTYYMYVSAFGVLGKKGFNSKF